MERLLETILGSFLSDYVSTSKESRDGNLKAYLSSSGISLHDIEFNVSQIRSGDFVVDMATASALEVKVPWSSLTTQPIEIHLSDVEVSLCNKTGNSGPKTVSTSTSGNQSGDSPDPHHDGSSSDKAAQSWLSTSIQSRLVRHAANLSIFVKNLLLRYKCLDSLVLSCRVDSLSLVNIPDQEWTGLVRDPNAWLSKGILIQGMRISLEKDGVSIGEGTINSFQLSCLLPLFALLGEEQDFDGNQKIPVFAEISLIDLKVVDGSLEAFYDGWYASEGGSPMASPNTYRKDETRNWNWTQQLKIEETAWTLDIGLTVGRCKVLFISNKCQNAIPYKVDISLDHLILHLESEDGASKGLLAIESWTLDILEKDSLSWKTVFKGLPHEHGSDLCKHAIAANMLVSKVQKSSFEINVGEIFLNIPWDGMDILNSWIVWWSRFIPSKGGETNHDAPTEFSMSAQLLDMGISYKSSRLSFRLIQIEVHMSELEAEFVFGISVGLQGNPPAIADSLVSLSNQIRVVGKLAGNTIECNASPIHIVFHGLDLIASLYGCCFGRLGENFVEWVNLSSSTPLSISCEISEIQSSFDLKKMTLILCADLVTCVNVGNSNLCVSIAGLYFSLSTAIAVDMGTLRVLVNQSSHSTPLLQIIASCASFSQNLERKKVYLPSLCVDVEIQRLVDIGPLIQCLHSLTPEDMSTPTTAEMHRESLPVEIDVETISLATRLEDRRWSFWFSGLHFVKSQCNNTESLTVLDLGAALEASKRQITEILYFQRKRHQCHVFTMQRTSKQEGELNYEVKIANLELRLPPGTVDLAKGMAYIKECLVYNYNCIFRDSKNIPTKLDSTLHTTVHLEQAEVFLLPFSNQPFRSIRMTLSNSKVEYQQSSLKSGRPWLNKNLHTEMDRKVAVSMDGISMFLTDGAEQSSLMLPFSMRSILGIWPVGNRKHFDICTSSLVLKLDSCSIQDILHLQLCHCPRMKFPTYPQNHIPDFSANHDLDLAVSLSLAKATFADFNLDLSAEIILHRLFTGSISWIYKYPRTITSVSLQEIFLHTGVPPLKFTLLAINSEGDSESSFSFELDVANASFTLESLGYHNGWKLLWINPIESLDWIDICRCIRVYSRPRKGDISFPDIRLSWQMPKVEIFLCPRAWPGRTVMPREHGFTDVVTQLSATNLSGSLVSRDVETRIHCVVEHISLTYTDPFDHCPLTFARGSGLDIFYLKEVSSRSRTFRDWMKDIRSIPLKDDCYAALLADGENLSQEILINTETGINVFLTGYVFYDLKYIWDAAAGDTMDYYLKIENELINTLSVKQSESTQILYVSQGRCEGFLLKYNKPRLLQFAHGKSSAESFWTDPVNVFTTDSGSRTVMLSDSMIIRVTFHREGKKGLVVTVTNGAKLVNSTSSQIRLQIDQEENSLKPGEAVNIFNLDASIRIALIDAWSDPIRILSDSEMVKGHRGTTLLVNRDLGSKDPVYHICFPVTLTNLLSEKVKIDNYESIDILRRDQTVDLSLSMEGGLLAQVCLSIEDKDSSMTALLCPGYRVSEASAPDTKKEPEMGLMVPGPDQSDILIFDEPTSGVSVKAILTSTLSRYNTLNLSLSPELIFSNQTNKTAIFRTSNKEYKVLPYCSRGINAIVDLLQILVILADEVEENSAVETSKIDTEMPMEGIFDAFTRDYKRSLKIAIDVNHAMGQKKIIIQPYFFISNNTEYYFNGELTDTYGPGFTGPLVCPTDISSGDFILTRSKLRVDGTFLNVDNHIISLERFGPREQDGDLSYFIIAKSDRVHLVITTEEQNITIFNCLDEDILVSFLTEQGEMLRSMYIIQGSQHKVSLQRSDQTLRLTIGKQINDIPIQDIVIGAMLAIGDAFIYMPRAGSIEIRSCDRKVDLSFSQMRVFLSGIQIFFYYNPRLRAEQDALRVDLRGIEGIVRRGLIPEFSTGSLSISEQRMSLSCLEEGERLCGSFSRLQICIEGFLDGSSKSIEYIWIRCLETKICLDDEILSMFVKLFGSRDSTTEDVGLQDVLRAESRSFIDCSLLIRRVVLDEILINLDVHLSKSSWLPIAVDASSAKLSVGKIDHHCQSTVESVGRVLKDHFADCLVRSAPYLFGSLQVLFDPVGLIRSVRRGLFDMVRLPLQGLQNRSLASFLSGLGYGSATFVREISSWSIGASVGFSRAMVKLVLNESEQVTSKGESRDGADLRMSRGVVYGLNHDQVLQLVSCTDQLWYSNLVDAKISLRNGTKVTLKMAEPVILVHRKGMVIFAHCGYTPSFYLGFDKSTYTFLGSCSVKITSEDCRSFTDPEKVHPIDMYLTTLPEDIDILTTLLNHCCRE